MIYTKAKNTCLLITGCIRPDYRVPILSVTDETVRRRQYIDSIRYYISSTKYQNIIFCDNSCSKPEEGLILLAEKKEKQFEWISFVGNSEMTIKQGKGYGEGEIIEYAMKHSKILHHCKTIVKVTGRLLIHNIDWCLLLNGEKYAYFDISPNYIDTRLYITPVLFYNANLIEAYKRVNDNENVYLEHVFFNVLKGKEKCIRQIPFYVNISGQSGSQGLYYQKVGFINLLCKSTKKIIKGIIIRLRMK